MPAILSKDDEIWNAALYAAVKAIQGAPVFTKQDRGAAVDGECIRVLSICGQEVRKLLK